MAVQVSVLLPVYNSGHCVSIAIESIINQSFQDFEMIIVNDGSTDNTLSILKGYENKQVKIYDVRHGGVAKAANTGLTYCKGEYVARMDADDWSDPMRLEKQIKYLNDHPEVDIVASKVKYWGDNGPVQGFEKYVDWTNQLIDHESILSSRFVDSPIVNPSAMFKRDLIKKYGVYSEGPIPEDYEMWLRWMAEGVKFAKIDEVLFAWKDSEGRLTRTHDNYLEGAFLQIKSKYFKRWLQNNKPNAKVYIWGHGSKMRKRSKHLEVEGIEISGYIDIEKRESENSIFYKETDSYKKEIVLGFVADQKGKTKISRYLSGLNMKEGIDFFHFV